MVSGTDSIRPPKVDNQLLRIGQEAITNAVRHAEARRIHLEITFGSRRWWCCVSRMTGAASTGCVRTATTQVHYGLTTMRERAEELGGTLTITSSAGRGTVIEADIPRSGHARNSLPAAI